MKKIVIYVGLVFFCLCSSQLFAQRVWLFKNVLIEDVSFLSISGWNITQIKLSDVSSPTASYSCAPTSVEGIVSVRSESGNTDRVKLLMSAALAAQAQGLLVDVLVDTSNCSTSGTFTNGTSTPGMGLYLSGIKAHAPD